MVMNRLMLAILFYCFVSHAEAQKYITEESRITFFSEAPLEDIDAYNTETTSIFDIDTRKIVISVPIRGFKFKKSLMQEHFNEKYLESDKFPKATFNGTIEDFELKSGLQKAIATGDLTIHGVTRHVELKGDMEMIDGKINMSTSFIVKLVDYKIDIPSLFFKNIAEEVEVKAKLTFKEYGK